MSNEAVTYVQRLRLEKPTRKLILLCLADRADEQFSCFPRVPFIAAECEVQDRQVQKYLAWFRENGYISDKERFRPDGSQASNRYFLHGPWDNFGGTGVPFPEVTYPDREPAEDFGFREGTRAAEGVSHRTPGVVSPRTPRGRSTRHRRGVLGDTGGTAQGTPPLVSPGTPKVVSSGTPLEPSVGTVTTNPQVEAASPDVRRTGTGDGAVGPRGAFGASGKTRPRESPEHERLARGQAAALVVRAVPEPLLQAVSDARPLIALAVKALADRTPDQVVTRAQRRWDLHGHASRWFAGEVQSPTAVAYTLLEPGKCPDSRCDDGRIVDTGADCPRCGERQADWRRERRRTGPDDSGRSRTALDTQAGAPEGARVVPLARAPQCSACDRPARRRDDDGLCPECVEARTAIEAVIGEVGFDA